jgi:hypothetical protein
MRYKQCWEARKCDREPAAESRRENDICPASLSWQFDGVNGEQNGGRFYRGFLERYAGAKNKGPMLGSSWIASIAIFLEWYMKRKGVSSSSLQIKPIDRWSILPQVP